jgi:hypothetical protein
MGTNNLIAIEAYPNDRDVWVPIGIERYEMSEMPRSQD